MSPKISVVIPSFNKRKYISFTLGSIVNQDYKNIEIIVQDGGSTDGTVEIIKRFAEKYRNIVWTSKKDKGQMDAINVGLKKATGDILTFINADDIYEKDAFIQLSDAYKKHPDSLWFVGQGTVVNSSEEEIAKPVTIYKKLLLKLNSYVPLLITNYIMQPSVFLSKEAYKKYGPFTGTRNFVMEYDMWLKLGRVQMPTIINRKLSKFRIEPETKTKTMFKDLLKEDRKIVSRYTGNGLILLLHDLHNFARVLINQFV